MNGVDRDSYVRSIDAVWSTHSLSTWFWMLLPWSGRMFAKRLAAKRTLVVNDVAELPCPAADRSDLERHYIQPLRAASRVATDFAAQVPARSDLVGTIVLFDQRVPVYASDDHTYVAAYGLRQWWGPPTRSWEPGPPAA